MSGPFRSQQREVLTPQAFGVIGGGVINEAAVFQSAVTAAAAARRPLHLAGGLSIRVNSTISLPSNLVITGDGSCTLELGANATVLKATGTSNIRLSGFKIDGKRATYTNTANNAIHIDWTTTAGSNVQIKNVEIVDIGGVGIIGLAAVGTPSSDVVISDCDVRNCGAHGIITQDYISVVRIERNKVFFTGLGFADRPGITASRYGTDIIVADNFVVGSASAMGTSCHGISIDNSADVTVSGNVVRDWKGMAIEVGFVDRCAVVGNVLSDSTYGIALSGSETLSRRNTNITISGNTIYGIVGAGINSFITSATGVFLHKNVVVSGNNVSRCNHATTGIGVYLRHIDGLSVLGGSSTDNVLSGLYIEDCPNHFVDGIYLLRNNLVGVALKTVTTLTSNLSTATATVAAHGWALNDVVGIWGASPTEFNQVAAISNVTADTFDYALPRSGLGTAAGGIFAGKAFSTAHGGLRITWPLLGVAARGFNRLGRIVAAYNGYRDLYDISLNDVTGFLNDKLYLADSATNPRAENLTSALSANVKDRIAIQFKNGKFVIAYNNAGATNYLSIPLDGTTATWTNSATAP